MTHPLVKDPHDLASYTSLPQPFFSHDEGFYLHWTVGQKELYIEFEDDHRVSYVKMWGVNIEHEMETGYLDDVGFDDLWAWLTTNEPANVPP